MTETPEQAEEPATSPVATLEPPPAYVAPVPVAIRPNRLYQAVAWVAIVAGTIFIVGAVFFTGFALGRHSGHGGGWHHGGGGGKSQHHHHRGGPGMVLLPRPHRVPDVSAELPSALTPRRALGFRL
jgi:hypothetical protein